MKLNTTDDQDELFYWVDENDNELGKITRREAHSGSLKIQRAIWVMVFNDRKKLFLQKRSLTKDLKPGVWSLSACGHVTYGQTYEEAAKREFEEELGVKAPMLTYVNKFLFKSKLEREIGVVYKAEHNGPFRLNRKEIDTGRFFALPELENQVRQKKLEIANWALAIIQFQLNILPELPDKKESIIKVFEKGD